MEKHTKLEYPTSSIDPLFQSYAEFITRISNLNTGLEHLSFKYR